MLVLFFSGVLVFFSFSDCGPRSAVVFPVFSLMSSGFSCISVPASFAVVLPVIAKGENPGVFTVKYRYLSSSLNRVVVSSFHFLPLYLFRMIED